MLKLFFKLGSSAVLLIFTAFVFLLYWGPGHLPEPGEYQQAIHSYGSPSVDGPSDSIRVMSYNIAYGFGMGSDGTGYKPKTADEIEANIRGMADRIREDGADIVLIQEIDFDADRSGNMDQLKMLSELTGLSYGAEAVSWDANYVPFPYWPFSYHFGRTKSGGAILSRYPIVENRVMILNKPSENAWYYNRFYLYRFHQAAGIVVNSDTIYVVNNHLEAFSSANRMEHARSLADYVDVLSQKHPILAIGGDMNALPAGSVKVSDFNDDSGDDYTGDQTMEILTKIDGFTEIARGADASDMNPRWYTFPTTVPNRRLDYIFVNNRFSFSASYVIESAGELSDHLPVGATIRFLP